MDEVRAHGRGMLLRRSDDLLGRADRAAEPLPLLRTERRGGRRETWMGCRLARPSTVEKPLGQPLFLPPFTQPRNVRVEPLAGDTGPHDCHVS